MEFSSGGSCRKAPERSAAAQAPRDPAGVVLGVDPSRTEPGKIPIGLLRSSCAGAPEPALGLAAEVGRAEVHVACSTIATVTRVEQLGDGQRVGDVLGAFKDTSLRSRRRAAGIARP